MGSGKGKKALRPCSVIGGFPEGQCHVLWFFPFIGSILTLVGSRERVYTESHTDNARYATVTH